MKRKLKIILPILLFIIFELILTFVLFLNKGREETYKSDKNQCKVIDELRVSINDFVPNADKFIKGCNKKGTISYYLNNEKIDLKKFTEALEYKVVIKIDNKKYNSKLIVEDSNEIVLEVKPLEINFGDSYTALDFVTKCNSPKGKCSYSFSKEEMAKYKNEGTYDIVIVAKVNNKTVSKKVKLTIKDNNSNKESNKNEDKSKNNTNNSNTNNSAVKVNTISETTTSSSVYKYGVTLDTTTTIYYDVYNDGSKKEVNRTTSSTYNYNNFNATTNELKSEAVTLANSNYGISSSVVSYVNSYRNEINVFDISMDNNLNIAASIRALEIGWSKKFAHTRPNGSDASTVLDELGIEWYNFGENIANGYSDAASVSYGWKTSQGHYDNMVSPYFKKMGVGMATVDGNRYWVQIFTN